MNAQLCIQYMYTVYTYSNLEIENTNRSDKICGISFKHSRVMYSITYCFRNFQFLFLHYK